MIMLGGVIVNLIVGIIIYMGVLSAWGEKYLPVDSMKDGDMVC
jgi:regulator of sigma E protease